MPTAGRSRTIVIVGASGFAHVLVLTLIALHAPRLNAPPSASGPPQAIIPVLIMPRLPLVRSATGPRPSEIRLHRRPQRFAEPSRDVAPLLTNRVATPRTTRPDASVAATASTVADPLIASARAALRSRVGCANPEASGLSRAERDACADQLAAGARNAGFLGLGPERGKAASLARAAASREADFRYKRGLPGPPAPAPVGAGWDEQRSPPKGASNLGMGAAPHDLGAEPLKIPF